MRSRAPQAALLLVPALAGLAVASTVLRFGPNALTDRAQVIVHGTCVHLAARQLPDGAIVTDYRLEVHELLKGARGKVFSFTSYGGVLGERGSAVAGAPEIALGEEVLLFLDRTNRLGCRTAIGLAQGKYSIRLEKGEKLAYRDLEGLRLLDPDTGSIQEAESEQGVPFGELLAQVKERLERAAKQRDAREGDRR